MIDGTGAPLGAKAGGVSGNVTSAGLDSPPSAECGSGLAWAEIDPGDGSGSWLVCFQAPSLVWDFVPGSPAEVAQVVNEHPIAPASIHTTLRSGGALIAHAEQAYYEAELALPDGVAIARGEQVCASPEDFCQIEGYSATVVVGEESAGVMAGESVTLGGYRTYVDRYFTLKTSSACDSGDADIRVAVLPAPR
ncbi:MAG: hypothetical protein R3B70_00645 [Polyangiaceae bacterium]